MACGIEDAGFEVRDCFAWLFGQGYPKSLDVGRVVDMELCQQPGRHCMRTLPPERKRLDGDHVCEATELGKAWAGFGTGLKPSNEPILVARKPLVGTIAENVLKYGTGALNVAACRLGYTDEADRDSAFPGGRLTSLGSGSLAGPGSAQDASRSEFVTEQSDLGRWPANTLLDELAAEMLDDAVGELVSGANPSSRQSDKFRDVYGAFSGGGVLRRVRIVAGRRVPPREAVSRATEVVKA
jgi:site-specific DNA-methyltransferase (adenine-specific)